MWFLQTLEVVQLVLTMTNRSFVLSIYIITKVYKAGSVLCKAGSVLCKVIYKQLTLVKMPRWI